MCSSDLPAARRTHGFVHDLPRSAKLQAIILRIYDDVGFGKQARANSRAQLRAARIRGRDRNFFTTQELHERQQLVATGALSNGVAAGISHKYRLGVDGCHQFWQLAFGDFDVLLVFE